MIQNIVHCENIKSNISMLTNKYDRNRNSSGLEIEVFRNDNFFFGSILC